MAAGGGQAIADAMDHLLRHQVPIAQPEFIVVAERQGPAPAHITLAQLGEELHQIGSLAVGHSREQMGGEAEIEGGV